MVYGMQYCSFWFMLVGKTLQFKSKVGMMVKCDDGPGTVVSQVCEHACAVRE